MWCVATRRPGAFLAFRLPATTQSSRSCLPLSRCGARCASGAGAPVNAVMPGLGPGIHVFLSSCAGTKDVDGRDKPGHDESEAYALEQMSVRADLRGADHRAPARGFLLDEGADLMRHAADRRHVHGAQMLRGLGRVQHLVDG